MTHCPICNSTEYILVDYDDHVKKNAVISVVKKVRRYTFSPVLKHFSRLGKYLPKKVRRVMVWLANPFRGKIFVCKQCGYGVMLTPPSKKSLYEYYTKNYWDNHGVESKAHLTDSYKKYPRPKQQLHFSLGQINSEISNSLEIGAAAARASLILREQIPAVSIFVCEPGVEWEEYYKKHGVTKVSDFFPFTSDKKFDYIHTSHWLEHVHNLEETIQSLKGMLRNGGYIFVEVPNTEYEYWDYNRLDTPHIHFFTPDALRQAFENHEFTCLKLGTYGVSYTESDKGIRPSDDLENTHPKGLWIRAIFKLD